MSAMPHSKRIAIFMEMMDYLMEISIYINRCEKYINPILTNQLLLGKADAIERFI
jgi:hypothetical protein